MCRFQIRQPQGGGEPVQPKLEAPLDLDTLFEHGTDDLDANDLALLALFTGQQQQPAPQPVATSAGSSNGSLPEASNTVVVGQALTAPATQQPAAALLGAAPAAPPANPVQQLQFQAVLQHQAAIMQNPQAYPAAAQMYQQALLQQQQQQQQLLAAQQAAAVGHAAALSGGAHASAMAAPAHASVLVGKRGKTQEEVEEQTERIKKRRRESAQRSRQRKNAYMKSLEMENRALKLENERLRMELSKCGGSATAAVAPLAPMAGSAAAPKASSGSVSRRPESLAGEVEGSAEHVSMSGDEEEELCDPLLGGGLHADPLSLMHPSDLLNFAF